MLKLVTLYHKRSQLQQKPFTDGEFIKGYIESAAEILCPSQKHLFTKVSLSRVTVARRIEELIDYSIALDESTDIADTAKLVIVVRGIDDDFNITEEMAALFTMEGTAKGSVLLNALQSTLRRFNLKLNSLSGVVTDGALAMVGKDKRLMALI
jgi:hypothetical protein